MERSLELVVHLVLLIAGLVFVFYGWQLVQDGWNQISEIAELPMDWDLRRLAALGPHLGRLPEREDRR